MESVSHKDHENIFFVENEHTEVSQTLRQKSSVTGISPENKKVQKLAQMLPKTRSKGQRKENFKTSSPENSPELLHSSNRRVFRKTDFTVAFGASRNVEIGYHMSENSPENFAGKSPESDRTAARLPESRRRSPDRSPAGRRNSRERLESFCRERKCWCKNENFWVGFGIYRWSFWVGFQAQYRVPTAPFWPVLASELRFYPRKLQKLF